MDVHTCAHLDALGRTELLGRFGTKKMAIDSNREARLCQVSTQTCVAIIIQISARTAEMDVGAGASAGRLGITLP